MHAHAVAKILEDPIGTHSMATEGASSAAMETDSPRARGLEAAGGAPGDQQAAPELNGAMPMSPSGAAAVLQSAVRASAARQAGAAGRSSARRSPPAPLELPVADGSTVRVPGELAGKLRGHQREGVEFLACGVAGQLLPSVPGVRGCLLGDEPGLGKTIQVIALLTALMAAGKLARALISRPGDRQGDRGASQRWCGYVLGTSLVNLILYVLDKATGHWRLIQIKRSPRQGF